MTDPTLPPYIAPHLGYAIARTNVRTNATDVRVQDLAENPRVSYAVDPVDGVDSPAWFDLPLTQSEAFICLERTRRILDSLQAEQETLWRELEATGLVTFSDRIDWLTAHANPLDALAYELNAAHLAGWHPPQHDRAMPKPIKRMPRYRPTPAQLEIALRVLDNQKVSAA